MSVQKKTLIQIGVIVVALAFLVIRQSYDKGQSKEKPLSLPMDTAGLETISVSSKMKDSSGRIDTPEDKIPIGRNPFRMPDEVAESKVKVLKNTSQPENLILEGVILGPNGNLAIISGNVVKEGEVVNEATVSWIDENGVVLTRNGVQIKLKR